MTPTFDPGARVFTVAVTSPLERGDIVLLDDGRGEFALKRVVGLPGETLHLWRGYVFIDRKLLIEPYLPKYTFTFPCQKNTRNKFTLADSEYFVLGDNRLCSIDSRTYGPIALAAIKARVPSPKNVVRPRRAAYTLPRPGETLIRPLDPGSWPAR